MIPFETYCLLSETFTPKKIDYDEISKLGDVIYTTFHTNNLYYQVRYDFKSKEVGFGVSEDNINFDDKRYRVGNAIKVFNHVIYIIERMIKEYDISEIQFSGADERLSVMYSKMVKNNSFIQYFRKHNFVYTEYNNNHIFKREEL